jgi:hypothetical protein
MDCALTILLACFNWSGLYIDSGLTYQDVGEARLAWQTTQTKIAGGVETVTRLGLNDNPMNPYGRIAIGYEVNFAVLTWRLEASHVSSVATDRDRGVNAVSLSARWHPFRRR